MTCCKLYADMLNEDLGELLGTPKARAINDISTTLVSSACAQIEHERITKRLTSNFLEKLEAEPRPTRSGSSTITPLPAGSPWRGCSTALVITEALDYMGPISLIHVLMNSRSTKLATELIFIIESASPRTA